MQEQQSSGAALQAQHQEELAALAAQLQEAQAAADKAEGDARRERAGAQVSRPAAPTCLVCWALQLPALHRHA